MADKPTSETLFPAIGKVVDEADKKAEPAAVQAAEAGAEDDDRPVQEIESLCMKCYQQVRPHQVYGHLDTEVAQGVTRLLLTSIPFFREVIVMSFRCEHCGFQNNEIQSAGQIRRT